MALNKESDIIGKDTRVSYLPYVTLGNRKAPEHFVENTFFSFQL